MVTFRGHQDNDSHILIVRMKDEEGYRWVHYKEKFFDNWVWCHGIIFSNKIFRTVLFKFFRKCHLFLRVYQNYSQEICFLHIFRNIYIHINIYLICFLKTIEIFSTDNNISLHKHIIYFLSEI